MLTLFHHLFFLIPAGPLVYRFLARDSYNLTPEDRVETSGKRLSRRRGLLLMYIGAYGAAPAGWAAEMIIYHRRWNQVHMIGEFSGPLVSVFVVLFLTVLFFGFLLRRLRG